MSITVDKERLYPLDAIKFFGAVIIIFHHYQQTTGVSFPRFNFYGGRIYFGYVVELFFIISGFVTASQLERDKELTFKDFMLHKMIRLYPIPILSVLVYALGSWIFRVTYGYWWGNNVIGLWKVYKSIGLVFAGGGG